MKFNKLQSYKANVTIPVYGTIADAKVYLKKDVDAAIEELKTALNESEEARYEAGADAADYYQENRRLRRLLWRAIALFCARSCEYFNGIMSHCLMGQDDLYHRCEKKKNKYINAMYKCKAKAEEYK